MPSVRNEPDEMAAAVQNLIDPRQVAYLVASVAPLSQALRQEILELDPLDAKLRRLVEPLQREIAVRELGNKITTDTRERLSKSQREFFLREQLRSIQKELGEDEGGDSETADLRRRLGCPVGVITAAWGGTPIQTWMGLEAFRREPPLTTPLAAWETAGQVQYAPVGTSTDPARVVRAPGGDRNRKHPALAVNARGDVLLAWTVGMGWQRGGSVAWQVFSCIQKPYAEQNLLNFLLLKMLFLLSKTG